MPSTEKIRAEQQASWSAKATGIADAMRDLDLDFTGGRERWAYVPPASDDWTEWSGIALWCAIQARYKWCIRRYVELCDGKGPYYCANHEEHIEGGYAALCLGCSWDAYLQDEAMADARAVRGIQQRQRQAVAS